MWCYRVTQLDDGTAGPAAFITPKTDTTDCFEKRVSKHICETYDPTGTGMYFFEVSLYTEVFLGGVFFRAFSSEAKLGISVPYLSSKNCAFPALRPNWKI